MLRLARFFRAGTYAFQKLLLRNGIVGFHVVSADACSGTDKLADNPTRRRPLWNCFRKIDNRFTKSRRSFFQVVNARWGRLFANKRRVVITPKPIVVLRRAFGLRHSFVIRHSSFVILVIPSSFVIPASSFSSLVLRHSIYPLKKKIPVRIA